MCSALDLVLTELIDAGRHLFLLEVGSTAGADLVGDLPLRAPTEAEITAAEEAVARTSAEMGRSLDTSGLKELLQANPNHPRWDEVADRCLACGNCTTGPSRRCAGQRVFRFRNLPAITNSSHFQILMNTR